MITAERALALASIFANDIENLRCIERNYCMSNWQKTQLAIYSDAEKIFRHYAEIMQAEPVKLAFYRDNSVYLGEKKPGAKELIIKPEPLK